MTGGPGIDSIIKHNAAMKAQNAELQTEIERLRAERDEIEHDKGRMTLLRDEARIVARNLLRILRNYSDVPDVCAEFYWLEEVSDE